MVWDEQSHFARTNRNDHGVAWGTLVDSKRNLFKSLKPYFQILKFPIDFK